MTGDYQYSAMLVNSVENMWMVKRWKDNPKDYTECLISVQTNDDIEAIMAAIERNSWA